MKKVVKKRCELEVMEIVLDALNDSIRNYFKDYDYENYEYVESSNEENIYKNEYLNKVIEHVEKML